MDTGFSSNSDSTQLLARDYFDTLDPRQRRQRGCGRTFRLSHAHRSRSPPLSEVKGQRLYLVPLLLFTGKL